ncbi:hypothetical protein HYS91_05575 [Candidatus Daviesbacteria bacterium]|nr:hypothetical protein [Candidatus Daviesbacteria bacterium]
MSKPEDLTRQRKLEAFLKDSTTPGSIKTAFEIQGDDRSLMAKAMRAAELGSPPLVAAFALRLGLPHDAALELVAQSWGNLSVLRQRIAEENKVLTVNEGLQGNDGGFNNLASAAEAKAAEIRKLI